MREGLARLARAIRKGARLCPQAFGAYTDPDTGGTSAIGAAYHALAGHTTNGRNWFGVEMPRDYVFRRCGLPRNAWVRAKGYDGITGLPLHLYISMLNDNEHLSREQIADTVEAADIYVCDLSGVL